MTLLRLLRSAALVRVDHIAIQLSVLLFAGFIPIGYALDRYGEISGCAVIVLPTMLGTMPLAQLPINTLADPKKRSDPRFVRQLRRVILASLVLSGSLSVFLLLLGGMVMLGSALILFYPLTIFFGYFLCSFWGLGMALSPAFKAEPIVHTDFEAIDHSRIN